MLAESLLDKRCIMVCGGGGVGKTTIAASLAIAAAKVRKRVLVVTIDPAKRLLQAFGFENAYLQEGGEPLPLSKTLMKELGLPENANLSIAVLNPKYVLNQILDQTLPTAHADKLRNTTLFSEMSQMIYGLQEYTDYEWVTRMIQNNEYDIIVLDTPPAAHAKDFFGAPEKIRNLMESGVFQMFIPKKSSWFSTVLSFNWLEKLLGHSVFGESKIFFETFAILRLRILERCELLAQFFKNDQVAVVAVSTPETSAQIEFEGLSRFLLAKHINIESLIVNQVETLNGYTDDSRQTGLSAALQAKLNQLRNDQTARAGLAKSRVNEIKSHYPGLEIIPVAMNYASDGFEVLRANSIQLGTN